MCRWRTRFAARSGFRPSRAAGTAGRFSGAVRPSEHKEPPRDLPIAMLPIVAGSIADGIADARDLYGALSEGLAKPHVLDDTTLDRVEAVYSETLEWVEVYERQLQRWQLRRLSISEGAEVDRLAELIPGWREQAQSCLQLASELKAGTTDAIKRSDPAELAVQVLLGLRPAP